MGGAKRDHSLEALGLSRPMEMRALSLSSLRVPHETWRVLSANLRFPTTIHSAQSCTNLHTNMKHN